MTGTRVITKLDEIVENFDYLDEWEDRYRYLIELGRTLEPLDEAAYCDKNKVRGCASQVWLVIKVLRDEAASPVLYLKGDSDAHIVRGLVALLLALYSRQTAARILAIDAHVREARAVDPFDAAAGKWRARYGRADQGRGAGRRCRGVTLAQAPLKKAKARSCASKTISWVSRG
jgi:cysteine desulfuration protein SufE